VGRFEKGNGIQMYFGVLNDFSLTGHLLDPLPLYFSLKGLSGAGQIQLSPSDSVFFIAFRKKKITE